jgi:predicted house-cleaning NTP pyrophosphatase (Maf/HAM1 superfamily)
MKLILASASPRRKALLEMLHVPNLEIRPAVGEERRIRSLRPTRSWRS